ncbi:ATP-binding cassette domain-containing protein, partial [Candidatus Saccharibacteria bacterium]|nr:ATP-binding cassette domain-containing protein [Candidatus Saccharibacteria bacterium]
VSLVFQNYNLIDYLTPLENLQLVNPRATTKTLRTMGLDDEHINRNVMKLSGGQQQRAAIGRALVTPAPIILADEPTGNLDEATAGDIIDILHRVTKRDNKCVIVVTHSKRLAKTADIVLRLKAGKLVEQDNAD